MQRKLMKMLALSAAVCAVLSAGAARAANLPSGAPVNGIRCEAMEGSVMHIHQHLTLRDHGRATTIPNDIGRPLMAQCLYWIHTHTPDGLVHIESPGFRTFTLGDLFDVWGQPLSRTGVAGAKPKKGERVVVWVDGTQYNGDPRKIELTAHLDVTIEVGPPYAKPAPFTDWQGN
ncbi:MAG: hypothetical protein NVS3B7_16180 [Candidatus Elarobacter sp.]